MTWQHDLAAQIERSCRPLTKARGTRRSRLIAACAKSALVTVVLAYSGAAKADCGGTLQYMSCTDVRLTLLYIDAGADAWIMVSGNTAALPCATSGGLIRLPGASSNFKAVYATLLAAHMSSRIVNVRLHPDATLCTIAYVTMPG